MDDRREVNTYNLLSQFHHEVDKIKTKRKKVSPVLPLQEKANGFLTALKKYPIHYYFDHRG